MIVAGCHQGITRRPLCVFEITKGTGSRMSAIACTVRLKYEATGMVAFLYQTIAVSCQGGGVEARQPNTAGREPNAQGSGGRAR